jgi:hypothetical protein
MPLAAAARQAVEPQAALHQRQALAQALAPAPWAIPATALQDGGDEAAFLCIGSARVNFRFCRIQRARSRTVATARRRPALEALPMPTVSDRSVAKIAVLTPSHAKREGGRAPSLRSGTVGSFRAIISWDAQIGRSALDSRQELCLGADRNRNSTVGLASGAALRC